MYDLITVGSISVDLYFKGEALTFSQNRFQLALGGKYFTDYFYESIGGGAVNVAIGAKRNGLKTTLVAKIGNNPFKKLIYHELEEKKIPFDYCQLEDDYQNISVILLSVNGEKTVINYRNQHEQMFHNDHVKKHLFNTRWVYFSNVYYLSLSERIKLMQELKTRQIGVAINLGIKDCRRNISQLERLIKNSDIIIINAYEFAEMVKKDYQQLNFRSKLTNQFSFLQDKLVVVTDGEKGSYAYWANNYFFQPAEKVSKIIDTTGAGDAYTAGFLAEYIKTNNLQQAMSKGSQFATLILKKIGAN
jgi:ribokinase